MPKKLHSNIKIQRQNIKNKRGILFFVALCALITILYVGITQQNNLLSASQRLQRIEDIYSQLALPKDYILVEEDVFGDKRTYEWDSSRTYASSKTYTYFGNQESAAKEINQILENNGFSFLDEPYPGSVFIQKHYISDKGEYVRLTVSPAEDTSSVKMQEDDIHALDASSNLLITIKVNLDDNNE